MTPTVILHANTLLQPPARWDAEKHGECQPLAVRIEGEVVQSAWLPSPEELAMLNAGGHVVLTLYGLVPPAALHVELAGEPPTMAEATQDAWNDIADGR